MNETGGSYVTYTKQHEEIVNSGAIAINEFLTNANFIEKRSLLFCLDKYLDPYFGYNLTYFDEIIIVLEMHLFVDHNREVKEDIFQLITDYSRNSLDYLADNLEQMNIELLPDAIYALGLTFNKKYLSLLNNYENHKNERIRTTAKEAIETIKSTNSESIT